MYSIATFVLTAVLVLTGTSAGLAQTSATQQKMSQQNAGMLSEQELEAKLKSQGYTEIGMVKLNGNVYEARANKDGKSVAIEVDARSGKVISEGPSPRT